MADLMALPNRSLYPSRLERQTGQALDRIRAGQMLATAGHLAKLDIIADTTEAALMATANLSAMEALLAARTPHAARRLQHIADLGCLGMAEVVLKSKRGMY
jgi:hypothetical protein